MGTDSELYGFNETKIVSRFRLLDLQAFGHVKDIAAMQFLMKG